MRGKKHSLEAREKMSVALRGRRSHNWNGGRRTTPAGYVETWIPPDHPFAEMRRSNGYVLEHRLVMAEHLGRPLTDEEVVHHSNGAKDNNGVGNLELFESKGTHVAHHNRLLEKP
jgi:hypothetical protein